MQKDNFIELIIPPPVVFFVCAGSMWMAARNVPIMSFDLPARMTIALAVATAGGLFAITGIVPFLRAKTTLHYGKPIETKKLVVTGVFAVTRNPMYLALLLVLIGWAVYLANIAAMIPIPLFITYLNRFQIQPEERALIEKFPEEFEAYTKRVRRWL